MSEKDKKTANEEIYEIDTMLSDVEPADDSLEDILSEVYGKKTADLVLPQADPPLEQEEESEEDIAPEEAIPQNVVALPPVIRDDDEDDTAIFRNKVKKIPSKGGFSSGKRQYFCRNKAPRNCPPHLH